MRSARERLIGKPAVYRISSRLAEGMSVLTKDEREVLFQTLENGAQFCGVELLGAVVVPEGFDALIDVPLSKPIERAELIHRVDTYYGSERAKFLEQAVSRNGERSWKAHPLAQRYLSQLYELSAYVKLVKQNFSIAYNRRRGRRGTIWRDRYRSELVERKASYTAQCSAHLFACIVIEGKAQRAEEYLPSSYFRALRGDTRARNGIVLAFGKGNWRSAQATLEKLIARYVEIGEAPDLGEISPDLIERGLRSYRVTPAMKAAKKEAWETKFKALLEYRKEQGHCVIPFGWSKNPELRIWSRKQRSLRKSGKLSPERIRRLEKIGFSWERPPALGGNMRRRPRVAPFPSEAWTSNYNRLKSYFRNYGHSRVPNRYGADRKLGNWVWTQRQLRRKGLLHEDFIKKLDAVNLDWHPRRGGKARKS